MAAGETVVLPLAVTVPTLGLMVTVLALLVDQLKVTEPPAAIVLGSAAKRTICGEPGAPTVTVTDWVRVPLAPVAVRV